MKTLPQRAIHVRNVSEITPPRILRLTGIRALPNDHEGAAVEFRSGAVIQGHYPLGNGVTKVDTELVLSTLIDVAPEHRTHSGIR